MSEIEKAIKVFEVEKKCSKHECCDCEAENGECFLTTNDLLYVNACDIALQALRSQLTRKQNEPCEWRQEDEDGSHYSSSCGYEFEFNEDGPNSNDFIYCPKCGKPIAEIQWWVG